MVNQPPPCYSSDFNVACESSVPPTWELVYGGLVASLTNMLNPLLHS